MRPLIFILAIALTVVVALTIVRRQREADAFQVATPAGAESLPKLWPVPDFALTERSGQALSFSDLKGKVWVADFFYTTCPGPCPMLTSRLSDLHKALSKDDSVRLVSISSDPEKDTPEVLRAYAQQFHASERWLFLTGAKSDVYKLANEGFKLALAEDPNAKEPISHSTKLVLIDRTGTVRGFYDGLAEGQSRLVADIRRLQHE